MDSLETRVEGTPTHVTIRSAPPLMYDAGFLQSAFGASPYETIDKTS